MDPGFFWAVLGDHTELQIPETRQWTGFQHYKLVTTRACQGSFFFFALGPPISTTEDHGWYQKIPHTEAVWQMVGCVVI